jgi:hypothetical protein
MDQPRDKSGPVEPTPLEKEAPMDTRLVEEPDRITGISVANTGCVHRRLIDDVRTGSGMPTGKVRCLECGTIFDDPHRSVD